MTEIKGDCISRSALKEELENPSDKHYLSKSILDLVFKRIDNAPTVEPERPQGEWIYKLTWDNVHKSRTCNKCGYHEVVFPNEADLFCPNCGAEMRKGGAE